MPTKAVCPVCGLTVQWENPTHEDGNEWALHLASHDVAAITEDTDG